MTNYEKITMSVKELSEFIDEVTSCCNRENLGCGYCPLYPSTCQSFNCCNSSTIANWLNSEVEE